MSTAVLGVAAAALSAVEESKRRAAYKAVEDHFDPSYRYIGIGSGSTVVYVVEAIAAKGREITSKMLFVPTGDQSKQLIIEAGLPIGSIDALPPVENIQTDLRGSTALAVSTGLQDLGLKGKRQSLDVAFDGADEIDEDLNCIKGGGACLFQEKLVATSAKKFVCVAGKIYKLSFRYCCRKRKLTGDRLPQTCPKTSNELENYPNRDRAFRSTNYKAYTNNTRLNRS